MSVGLVALSASAIAGPDEAASGGELVATQTVRQAPGRLRLLRLSRRSTATPSRCFNTLSRPARRFFSSAERMG
jgi:hypothetical protein